MGKAEQAHLSRDVESRCTKAIAGLAGDCGARAASAGSTTSGSFAIGAVGTWCTPTRTVIGDAGAVAGKLWGVPGVRVCAGTRVTGDSDTHGCDPEIEELMSFWSPVTWRAITWRAITSASKGARDTQNHTHPLTALCAAFTTRGTAQVR